MNNKMLDFEKYVSEQRFDIKEYLKALMEINKPHVPKQNGYS